MAKKTSACPSCGSANVRRKKGWPSVSFWGVLLFLAFLLTRVQDDVISSGSTALAIVLAVLLAWFAASAIWGRNRCRECDHTWK